MNIIYLLIIISLILIVSILGVFFWAIRSGQYDDLDKPGYDVLMDDDDHRETGRSKPGAAEYRVSNDADVNAGEDPEKQ